MNRFRDHLRFAVQFAGLGYVVLWPVSTPARGDLFGASVLCPGHGPLGLVCGLPHPLQMSMGLHVTGALCAVVAALHLFVRGACRLRGRRKGPEAESAAGQQPAAAAALPAQKPRARRPRMPPPRRNVAPRTHFGLRGLTR